MKNYITSSVCCLLVSQLRWTRWTFDILSRDIPVNVYEFMYIRLFFFICEFLFINCTFNGSYSLLLGFFSTLMHSRNKIKILLSYLWFSSRNIKHTNDTKQKLKQWLCVRSPLPHCYEVQLEIISLAILQPKEVQRCTIKWLLLNTQCLPKLKSFFLWIINTRFCIIKRHSLY